MSKLWDTIGQLVHDMAPARALAVADGLVKLKAPDELRQISALFGPGVDASRIKAIGDLWEAEPHVSADEVSGAFRGAAHFAKGMSNTERVELVWTGPKTGVVPTRSTEQVYLEVIDLAEREIFISCYVFHRAEVIYEALNKAADRGVSVQVLLEPSESEGGKIKGDPVVEKIAGAVPAANVFLWDHATHPGQIHSSVHAKYIVVDHAYAFVTSANLTINALEKNMELGVLIRGGHIPEQLHAHSDAMVSTGVIMPANSTK